MSNCASFLELASAKCGVDVGYGKLFLLYKDKKTVTSAMLTATAINAEIEAGTIIGVIKGWHTVAGAPVGELTVERPFTAEITQIRAEILAETLTFESNILNRDVMAGLAARGTLNGVLVDDLGSVFGETSQTANAIDTMYLNFSAKTSSSLQRDNTTDKSVAVTVRYLVKDMGIYEAGIEVEEVNTKIQLYAGISTVVSVAPTSMVIDFLVREKGSNNIYAGALIAADFVVEGAGVVSKTVTYTPTTGIAVMTVTGTGFVSGDTVLNILVSNTLAYMKSTSYTVRLGE